MTVMWKPWYSMTWLWRVVWREVNANEVYEEKPMMTKVQKPRKMTNDDSGMVSVYSLVVKAVVMSNQIETTRQMMNEMFFCLLILL